MLLDGRKQNFPTRRSIVDPRRSLRSYELLHHLPSKYLTTLSLVPSSIIILGRNEEKLKMSASPAPKYIIGKGLPRC